MAQFTFTLDAYLAHKRAGTLPPLKRIEPIPARFADDLKALQISEEQMIAEDKKIRAKNPAASLMVIVDDGEPLSVGLARAFAARRGAR